MEHISLSLSLSISVSLFPRDLRNPKLRPLYPMQSKGTQKKNQKKFEKENPTNPRSDGLGQDKRIRPFFRDKSGSELCRKQRTSREIW